jgi:hypothetical protein
MIRLPFQKMQTMPRLALCFAVALAIMGNKGAEGIGFDLISSKVKCFSEEISGNTLVVSARSVVEGSQPTLDADVLIFGAAKAAVRESIRLAFSHPGSRLYCPYANNFKLRQFPPSPGFSHARNAPSLCSGYIQLIGLFMALES